MDPSDAFPTDATGLPSASTSRVKRLADGDTTTLRIAPVAKRLGDATLRMLAYSSSIPGPCLHVDQGTEIRVEVTNDGDVDATVHWHGLRVDHRQDGVPYLSQPPIPPGGSFVYTLRFPDAGVYWYHPHIREDYAQDMGLYGVIVVEPSESGYWPPADRWYALTLDDLLVEEGRVAPYLRSGPTFAMMGRFGNVFLADGDVPPRQLHASPGEVLRLYLVNTANTRVFDLVVRGANVKLIGGDSGRYERESLVTSAVLAPSERVVLDVLVPAEGPVVVEHRSPTRTVELARIGVAGPPRETAAAASFEKLRSAPELLAERASIRRELERDADRQLAFVARMGQAGTHDMASMHHDMAAMEHRGSPSDHLDGSETDDGIEWEDTMLEMNRASTAASISWAIVDTVTGAENADISWSFRVGDRVKIRVRNETTSDHPMQHPFHVHGAGRFLVLTRDGAPEPNLVWKDTVLVPAGAQVDLLLEITNPGRWMAHCHIAEHHEAGMAFSFDVVDG